MIMGIAGWLFYIGMWCFNLLIGWAVVIASYGVGLLCLMPLLCLSPLLWLVGVITGHIAKAQIRERGESGEGMATTGLILGYTGLILNLLGVAAVLILTALGIISLGALAPYTYPSY
jgi:hypothetical protein